MASRVRTFDDVIAQRDDLTRRLAEAEYCCSNMEQGALSERDNAIELEKRLVLALADLQAMSARLGAAGTKLADAEHDYKLLEDEARRTGPDGYDPIACIQNLRKGLADAEQALENSQGVLRTQHAVNENTLERLAAAERQVTFLKILDCEELKTKLAAAEKAALQTYCGSAAVGEDCLRVDGTCTVCGLRAQLADAEEELRLAKTELNPLKIRAADAERRAEETLTQNVGLTGDRDRWRERAEQAERRAEEHCCELETQDFRLQNDWEWKQKVDYQKQRAEKAERERAGVAAERNRDYILAHDRGDRIAELEANQKADITVDTLRGLLKTQKAKNAVLRAACQKAVTKMLSRGEIRQAEHDALRILRGALKSDGSALTERCSSEVAAIRSDGGPLGSDQCDRQRGHTGRHRTSWGRSWGHGADDLSDEGIGSALGDVLRAAECHEKSPAHTVCPRGRCDLCVAVRRYRKERGDVDPSTPTAGCGVCPECVASYNDPDVCTAGVGKERGE